MAFIQKFGFVAGPLLIMAAGSLAAQGCDPESVSQDVCGPCGDVTTGSVDISGSAQIDGFFAAVDKLSANADLATKGFAEGLANLEVAFNLEGNGNLNARVEAVIAAIEA